MSKRKSGIANSQFLVLRKKIGRWSAGFGAGMTFSEKVLKAVAKIPRGKVLTYKEVARLAGNPRAYRAVGNILNKNTRPDIIPCHRVIRSDGKIGGYRWGIKQKEKRLRAESVFI